MPRRNLIVLAVVTAVVTAIAVWGLVQHQRDRLAELKPGPVFPNLLDRVNDVDRIQVATRDESIAARRTDKGQWVVASHYDYPARPETVRRTIFALVGAKILDRATALPENHSKLGLVGPDKGGAATRVVLLDKSGNQLAALLIGKSPEGEQQPLSAPKEFFVRKPDENQVWVVHGDFPVEASLPLWLDPQIADIERTRIRSATVMLPDGTGYTVSRKAPDQPDFVLATVPSGREPAASPAAANDIGAAASILTFEDVRPLAKMTLPDKTRHVVYRTFDGLVLDVSLLPADGRTWAVFVASVDSSAASSAQSANAPGNVARGQTGAAALPPKSLDQVKAEAAAISAHVAGWAYRLPDALARDMSHPLEDLLAPKKPEKATAQKKGVSKKAAPKPKNKAHKAGR